uniref:Ubiquitin-like protease family profile domain-containing protein n=1 Tax=Oryza rufipogon TaxID=4529 RepID=A0A0E0MQJ1_ORYRU
MDLVHRSAAASSRKCSSFSLLLIEKVPFFDAVIFRRRRHSHPSGDEISHHLKLAQSPVPAGQPVSCATTGSLSVSAFFRESMGPSGREGSGEEVNLEVANMGEAASTEEGDADAIKEDEAASTEEGDADATKEGEASTAEVEMKDPKIHTRSSPNSVILAAQELSSDARNVVITAGFEQLLYMSLEGFGNREILRFLMNNTHTEQTSEGVEIKIEGSKLPPITENVVAHVVGVPEGSGESLEFEQDTKKQGEIKKAVHNLLKLPDSVDDCEPIADEKKRDRKHKTIMNGKIGVDYLRDVMEEAKETKDVELEVKSDCGFYMLLYMERFGRMKIDDINENDVLMYRKKLVKDIYENPNNNPKDVSDEVIAQDEYHILDDTICLSPPPSDLRNSPPRPNLTVSPMSHEDGRNDGPLPPSSPGTSDGNKNLEDAQPQEEADRSSVGIAENAEAGNQANHARTSDGNQKLDDAQAQGKANRSSEGSSLDTRTDNERSRTSDDEAGGNEVDEGEKGVPSSPPRREQNPSHALDKDIPNDSVFAAMYFLEHFIGVAGVLNKLTWDEKHKENTADVPDGILALFE